MCTPTNELKLCTCKFGKTLPDNYWILHRFTSKHLEMMGDLICDYNIDLTTAAEIASFISASINTANCFDKNLSIENKDVLEIHTVHNKAKYLYYYRFFKGRWTEAENFNAFDIENNYSRVSKGITKPELSSMLKNL